MADLRQLTGFSLLASVSDVDMKTVQKNNLFEVPEGKECIISMVIVRQPSASLAGGTDYDLGDGANCDTWKQTNDLSSMTNTAHYFLITSLQVAYVVFDAGDIFGIKPITGSTLAATATIDVFGYLF